MKLVVGRICTELGRSSPALQIQQRPTRVEKNQMNGMGECVGTVIGTHNQWIEERIG